MSIRDQKVIRYIPGVNIITLFFMLKLFKEHSISVFRIFRVFFEIAVLMIIMVILQQMAIPLVNFDFIRYLLNFVTSCFFCLGIAFIAVHEQEKVINEISKRE